MALLTVFALGFYGMSQAQETSGDFSGGSIQVSYDSRTCDGTLEGAIRYNSAGPSLQLCSGSAWTDF